MPAAQLPDFTNHRAAQLILQLQHVTQALAAVRREGDVFDIVLRDALDALGGIGGTVLLVQEGHLRVLARRGHIDASIWQDGDLTGHAPGPDALRSNTPLFFSHHGDLVAAYPELEAQTGGVAAVASAVLPMADSERPLGVIVLDFREPHDFTSDEQHFLLTLAAQCAIALERARLSSHLEAQVADRTAELEIFVAFTEAAGNETDVQVLVREAITLLVDTCGVETVYVERQGELFQPSAWSHQFDPTVLSLLQHGFPLQHSGIAKVLLQNTAAFIDHWNDTPLLIQETGIYQALAGYPYFAAGVLQSVLLVGSRAAPTWAERDKKIFRAVGRSLDLALERAVTARRLEEQNAELHAQTLVLEGVAELTRDLARSGSPRQLIGQVMDLVLSLLPSGYASYWEMSGRTWRLVNHRGDVGRPDWQAARERGFPVGQFPTLDRPWQTRQPYFQGQYDALHDGVPELMDHLLSVATLPVMVRGEVVGVFGVGLFGHRPWGAADQALLKAAVQSLGLGLERAEQLRQLEAESAAREAFTALTEAIGTETEVHVLAQQAIKVLRGRFPQASVAYYEREGEMWKARVWSSDLREEVAALISAGLPTQTPMIARMLQAGEAVFIDAWDPQRQQFEFSGEYGKVGSVPLVVEGQIRAMLSIGVKGVWQWSETSKGLVQAVGRALTLALERSETAQQLEGQNAELKMRTQALESFARLTRDLGLSSEPKLLIKRAMELALSLLPPGYALLWERHDRRWQIGLQVGEVGRSELQEALQAGLDIGQAYSLDQPYQTQTPFFQDRYDRTLDVDPALVDHIGTAATLPVLVNGSVLGIFTLVLFDEHAWSAADRAVLITTVQSLGLALERAEQARQLIAQRDMLQAVNEELEAFTYSVSHDLRTPVRHIISFGGLLRRALPEPLNAKAARYFKVIEEAAQQLSQLIDGMLELSRTSRQPVQPGPVDLNSLVASVRREVTANIPGRRITWQVGGLPLVMGDAALLRRVLMALLVNAVKYTQKREEAVIEVWAEDREQGWAILVRDNGVGFDPLYQGKLFSMFQRLHRQEDFEGAAMSLANARRIITRHGGQMTAVGQVDEGATFGFILPKAAQ